MRITPIDIRKQEFRRGMRGYDVDEVDTFLAMVADEMELLIGTAQKATDELTSLRERLAEYQQMEATMRETLVTVQKAAEQKKEAAQKEADIILKEAEVRAGTWIEEAHRSIREVKKELARLRGMRDSYVTRLKMLVQAQLDMLKVAEMEDETPEESLDLFEEKLEELTARARDRIEEAGEATAAGEAAAAAEAGEAAEEMPSAKAGTTPPEEGDEQPLALVDEENAASNPKLSEATAGEIEGIERGGGAD